MQLLVNALWLVVHLLAAENMEMLFYANRNFFPVLRMLKQIFTREHEGLPSIKRGLMIVGFHPKRLLVMLMTTI